MKNNDIYEIRLKTKRQLNEKHLEVLDENERKLIKHMAKMIVHSVIRKVEEEDRANLTNK